jgi:MGT family glycosyltransferase
MARFLIGTNPATGHTNPALPIAKKLVERGHEVVWYTGKAFQKNVEATGARFVPVKSAPDWSIVDILDWFRENMPELVEMQGMKQIKMGMKHVFINAAVGHLQDCLQILETFKADVILGDSLFVAGNWLQEKTGIPFASFGESVMTIKSRDTAPFGPALPPNASFFGRIRNRTLNFVAGRIIFGDVNRDFNEARQRVGLPTVKKTFFDSVDSEYVYMQGTVPSFEYPRSDLAPHIHFVGPFLPIPPANWKPPEWWGDVINSTRPVVHVTQGTVNNDATDLLIPAIQALANEDVLVVATLGGDKAFPLHDLPDNARVMNYIPHVHLLPHVSLMITNGGYGGVQNALAHGVPLVVAGTTEDKAEVAARIAWSGVGISLKTKTPTAEQVKAAALRVLHEPDFRRKARSVAAEMSHHDAPLEVALLLEELVATKKPVTGERGKSLAFSR